MLHRIAWFSCAAILVAGLAGCGGEKAEEKKEAAAPEATEQTTPSRTEAPETMTLDQMKAALAEKLQFDWADVKNDPSGLEYIVRQEGTGDIPKQGDVIKAHYTGYLMNGTKFDSSVDRGQPFQTPIGVGRVIAGWDQAFTSMKVGEKRILIIPPELGYGARGAGNVIPPNATLLFDVELLGIVK